MDVRRNKLGYQWTSRAQSLVYLIHNQLDLYKTCEFDIPTSQYSHTILWLTALTLKVMVVFLSSNKLTKVFIQERSCKPLQKSAPTQVPHQKQTCTMIYKKPPLAIPTLKKVPEQCKSYFPNGMAQVGFCPTRNCVYIRSNIHTLAISLPTSFVISYWVTHCYSVTNVSCFLLRLRLPPYTAGRKIQLNSSLRKRSPFGMWFTQ